MLDDDDDDDGGGGDDDDDDTDVDNIVTFDVLFGILTFLLMLLYFE